jgi:hypothetical protein
MRWAVGAAIFNLRPGPIIVRRYIVVRPAVPHAAASLLSGPAQI